ncbi:hypothetical protein LTR95_003038 [Oleoguttula sp. CCFEE 5521]
MEPPSAFCYPPRNLQQPLLPLSPERVNSRPSPTRSRRPDRDSDHTSDAKPHLVSQSCSPTRRANLFADYAPLHTTPTKSSAFGPCNLPQSPSLPEFTALRTAHVRTNSDVQGLVKRFETLDVRDKDGEVSALRKRAERAEMELQRAQVGREEAETEGRKLRQEVKELQERDRRWARRLEKVETQADAAQDRQTAVQTAENFQHAMRKKQSEVLKSGQKVLDLQTEFHKCQKKLEVSKMEQARIVDKAQRFAEEAMDAKNALSIRIAEYAKLEAHCQTAERESEILRIRMDERQLAEAAAEGAIALPGSMDEDDDLLASPRKATSPRKLLMRSPLSDDKENTGIVTKKMLELKRWQDDVEQERMKRGAAEDMVDFLRMECAFQCCDCALAAKHGRTVAITMDGILEASMQRIRADMQSAFSLPAFEHTDTDMDADIMEHDVRDAPLEQAATDTLSVPDELSADKIGQPASDEPEDLSMTLAGDAYELSASADIMAPEHRRVEHAPRHEDRGEEPFDSQREDTSAPSPDQTPATPTQDTRPFALRTITTTTQIPMHFTPIRKPTNPFHHPEDIENHDPGCAVLDAYTPERTATGTAASPFDREAALAAIAYRRGRAKSLANGHLTPRKQMVEGLGVGVEGGRRDVSAPVLGRGRVGTVSPVKEGSVGRAAGRAGMGM